MAQLKNPIHESVKSLRKSRYKNHLSIEIQVVSFKKYKKNMYSVKGYKESVDRITTDAFVKQANGRPVKWVESELLMMGIPNEWLKTVRVPLTSLLGNWGKDI